MTTQGRTRTEANNTSERHANAAVYLLAPFALRLRSFAAAFVRLFVFACGLTHLDARQTGLVAQLCEFDTGLAGACTRQRPRQTGGCMGRRRRGASGRQRAHKGTLRTFNTAHHKPRTKVSKRTGALSSFHTQTLDPLFSRERVCVFPRLSALISSGLTIICWLRPTAVAP